MFQVMFSACHPTGVHHWEVFGPILSVSSHQAFVDRKKFSSSPPLSQAELDLWLSPDLEYPVHQTWPSQWPFSGLIQKEILHFEGDEALDQVAQISCGCSMSASVQDLAGWSSEVPGLERSVPAHVRGSELNDL